MGRLTKLLSRAVFVVVMGLTILAPAVAAAQEAVPQPRLTRSPPVWLGYLITVVLLAVVMAVSLMPSKRGHQD
ncbi:MAG: hypothetical protein ACYS0G_14465 [Planctomycetota bacterium]